MAMAYVVTERSGGRVRRSRHADLAGALDAVTVRSRELAEGAPAASRGGRMMRRFEPVQQVVARLEVSGPRGLRAGLDVRGDGSSEAFTGRMRKQLVAQEAGESASQALARALRV
jgi:hypothetical protein